MAACQDIPSHPLLIPLKRLRTRVTGSDATAMHCGNIRLFKRKAKCHRVPFKLKWPAASQGSVLNRCSFFLTTCPAAKLETLKTKNVHISCSEAVALRRNSPGTNATVQLPQRSIPAKRFQAGTENGADRCSRPPGGPGSPQTPLGRLRGHFESYAGITI